MTATLHLVREKSTVMELRRGTFHVLLDENDVGSIDMHGTIDVPIEQGRHTLQLKDGRSTSSRRSFEAADGAIINWLSPEDVKTVAPIVGPGKQVVARIFVCPSTDVEQVRAVGRMMIAAMAIQNAIQRVHMASLPPTTIMTGNSTQLMLDVADFVSGHGDPGNRAIMRRRLGHLGRALAAFAFGCALAAVALIKAGMWCFALPPIIATATIWQRLETADK